MVLLLPNVLKSHQHSVIRLTPQLEVHSKVCGPIVILVRAGRP